MSLMLTEKEIQYFAMTNTVQLSSLSIRHYVVDLLLVKKLFGLQGKLDCVNKRFPQSFVNVVKFHLAV